MRKVKLGDKVKDVVSKVEGVVLARMEGLYEATQFRVHREGLTSDGKLFESNWFEEGRLEVIEQAISLAVGFQPKGKE